MFRSLLQAVMLMTVLFVRPVSSVSQTSDNYRHQSDSLILLLDTASEQTSISLLRSLYLLQYSSGQIDSCMATLDRFIDIQARRGDVAEESKGRWNKVAILNNTGHYEQLLVEADKQRDWFGQHGIWDRFYQSWQRKSSAYHDMGKMQTSLREAELMLDDAQRRNNPIGRAMALKQMGVGYMDIHQYEQAADAFKRGIELMRGEQENTGMRSGLYDHYCQVLSMMKRYEEVPSITDEWLQHLGELERSGEVAELSGPYCSAYLALASAQTGMGRYDEAARSIEEASRHNDKNPTVRAVYYILMQKAQLARALGQPRQVLALTDTLVSMPIADVIKYGDLRGNALMAVGRNAEAAQLFSDLYHQKDTTYSREMRMQLDELNTLFRVDELKMKSSLERTRWLVGIVSVVALALLIILFLHARSARQLRQKNEELRIANARAQESSQMKTQFIRNISHEIRTPLNILSGFSQVIASPDIDLTQENLTEIRNDIIENTDRITSLVNKMLELSDANSHAVIELSDVKAMPAEIAMQAVDASHIRIAENVVFCQDIGNDLPMLHTNAAYAERALTLLLDNAKKFIGQSGHVTLHVQETADSVLFVVEDDGIGIPPSEADRVFEEFVQLDEYYDGTGIGLTVARSIARRLGGDIVLDTSHSPGARFVFSLPKEVKV